MFFRRERPKHLTFEDHMNAARAAGFRTESAGGKTRIERNGIAVVMQPGPDGIPQVTERAGVVMGKGDRYPHGRRLSEVLHYAERQAQAGSGGGTEGDS